MSVYTSIYSLYTIENQASEFWAAKRISDSIFDLQIFRSFSMAWHGIEMLTLNGLEREQTNGE